MDTGVICITGLDRAQGLVGIAKMVEWESSCQYQYQSNIRYRARYYALSPPVKQLYEIDLIILFYREANRDSALLSNMDSGQQS